MSICIVRVKPGEQPNSALQVGVGGASARVWVCHSPGGSSRLVVGGVRLVGALNQLGCAPGLLSALCASIPPWGSCLLGDPVQAYLLGDRAFQTATC